jgi:CRP/FNR family transcriptional regulator, nitrogen fixation regulation protein
MYSTTTRHPQEKSVADRLVVPNHPVMQVAPGPHPPTPPSGATAIAPKYESAPTLQHRRNGTAFKQQLIPSAGTESLDLLIDRIGVCMAYEAKALIFQEHDPADRVYKVLSGSVCTCKNLSDGRRQIVGFYLPGDFFGFDCADEHTLSAEAVSSAKVLVIKKIALAAATSCDGRIERQVLLLVARELARLQDRVLLLVKNAQERVGEFILDMEKRAAVGKYVELPMRRQDIADYLGLTIESVSRILTALEKCAAIEILPRRGVIVRSHSLLRTMMRDRSETPAIWSCLKKSTSENRHHADRKRKSIQDRSAGGTAEQLNRRSGRVLTKEEVSRERERGKEERKKGQRLLDLFEGAKGRRPETDQELGQWLASPEGKAATAFELASVYPRARGHPCSQDFC